MAKAPDHPTGGFTADDPKHEPPKTDPRHTSAARAPGVDARHPEILDPDMVLVVVAEGRSVQHEAVVGTQTVDGQEVPIMAVRVSRPGQQIAVRSRDLPHLVATGFVKIIGQPEPPPPPPEGGEGEGEGGARADNNRGRVTIDGDDGTVVRAGGRQK